MRRFILSFIILNVCILSYARLGYYYKCEFIELTPEKGAHFIKLNYDSPDYLQIKQFVVKYIEDTKNTVQYGNDEFLVAGEINLPKNNIYISDIYKSSKGGHIVVLPKIYVQLKDEEGGIDMILEQFEIKPSVFFNAHGQYILYSRDLTTSSQILEKAAAISQLDNVLWCEPEKYMDIVPSNTSYWRQYYLHNTGQTGGTSGMDINVESAWDIVTASDSLVVAVIDMGIETNHEDLQNCVLSGYTCGNTSGNGAPQNPGTDKPKAHGMACAGIIGANDNTIGIKGTASGVKLLPINIFPNTPTTNNKSGAATDAQIATAIQWSYSRSDILSCSWSSDNYSSIIEQAIINARTYGRSGKGCVVVFSAGNKKQEGTTNVSFPSTVNGVISVGALDKNGVVTSYSQEGADLTLMAFGGLVDATVYEYGDIYTIDRNAPLGYNSTGNYYAYFNGTSAACPQVAGVVALMLSANPSLTESQVKNILCTTATDLGATGRDDTYGYGLVNAEAAVKQAIVQNAVFTAPALLTGTQTYSVSNLPAGATVTWTLSSGMTGTVSSDTYSCTITRPSSPPSVFGVTAKVYFNGVEIKTYTRTVFTTLSTGTYSQDACGYYGVNHPAIPTKSLTPSGTAKFVHMGCTVHVNSYCLRDATVTHSGITPEQWYVNTNTGKLEFSLPYGSSGMPFNIYVNGTTTYGHLLFFPVANNGNLTSSLLVSPAGDNAFELTLGGDDAASRSDGLEWDVEVYDTRAGVLTHNAHVMGNRYTIDASTWRQGSYVVRAVLPGDDEPLVEKIQVK